MPHIGEPTRSNVFYSVAEFVSQPLMMFVAAPLLLHALGSSYYGVWMLANSITATVSGLGGGFGDAAVKYISHYQGRSDRDGVFRALAAAFIVNVSLGLAFAAIMSASAPFIIDRVFHISSSLRGQAVAAVRVSAVLLLLKFSETVFSSAIRAFQKYRPSVTVAVIARGTAIVVAVCLALRGMDLTAILISNTVVGCLSLLAHLIVAIHVLEFRRWRLEGVRNELRMVLHFGTFTWVKSVLGVSFSHADRLLIAGMLGVTPLSHYVLCTQITQPIHSLIAAGFNFIFPALSSRIAADDISGARRMYRTAALTGLGLVTGLSLPLVLFGHALLAWWMGPEEAFQAYPVFILMVAANGLLAASIVPQYAALALGRARALAIVNFLSGAASLVIAVPLLRHMGVIGGAWMRCAAAIISLAAFGVVRESLSSADAPSLSQTNVFARTTRQVRLSVREQ